MVIHTRIPGTPRRENPFRTNKGRHPLLKNGSPHIWVWEVLKNAGVKGLTADGIKAKTTFYHPQVLKELMDAKLVAKLGKHGNEFVYVADPKGRGVIPKQVRVMVELLEDEEGFLHAVAFVVGSTQQPKGGVRTIKSRGINFVVPMEHEVENATFTKGRKVPEGIVLDGDSVEVITDPSSIIIDMATK